MSALAGAAAAQMIPSGPSGDKAKAIVMVMVVAAVIILAFIILKKIGGIFDGITGAAGSFLETIGLKDTAEEKARREAAEQAAKDAEKPDSPFNPKFYTTAPSGTALMTRAKADELAKQVWGSVGLLYDNPDAGFSAIKQCKNWASVSWLSEVFASKYGRDLFGWLQLKYDTDEQIDTLNKMVSYARSLPKY